MKPSVHPHARQHDRAKVKAAACPSFSRQHGGSTRRRQNAASSSRAFTLIEIIASLVLVGVLAAMLLPLLGTSLRSTVETSSQLADAYQLRAELEELIDRAKTEDLDDLPAIIDNEYPQGPIDGTWVWVDFENTSGSIFEQTAATTVPSDHLRVTLQHTTGHQLTFIFSRFDP